jgi:hypothetical protein
VAGAALPLNLNHNLNHHLNRLCSPELLPRVPYPPLRKRGVNDVLSQALDEDLAQRAVGALSVVGAILFGLYQRLGNHAEDAAAVTREIIVSQGRIGSLAVTFTRLWNRPPTQEELEGLIRDYIREEVMYREALALGLDRDDTIVRRCWRSLFTTRWSEL